jgi:hypothetical protein
MKPSMRLEDVPGWLSVTDQRLFEWILRWQTSTGVTGGLVELGAYLGKSAIHIGRFRQPGETFTVCDLFDDARSETTIRPDVRHTYRTLTQAAFEENYLAFHDDLPTIVRGLSSSIVDHVQPGSCRFVHVDASHLYEHVRVDTTSAQAILQDGGIVVFDDFRTEHTIGTAAAVWEAMCRNHLVPICASAKKMYATWGDPRPAQAEIFERLAASADHRADVHTIIDEHRVIRVVHAPPKPAVINVPDAPLNRQRLPWIQGPPRRVLKRARDQARHLRRPR